MKKKKRKKKRSLFADSEQLDALLDIFVSFVTVRCVGVGVSIAETIDFSQQRQITAVKHRIDPTKSALY